MKPVVKGPRLGRYAAHRDAKPDLIRRLGGFCSYCESPAGRLQNLDVEHIYPQKPHPKRARNWSNFLLACSSCNTYKAKHLGNGRQVGLLKRCYWPHLDNTFNAFDYHDDGRVTLRDGAGQLAQELMEMSGLIKSPGATESYQERGLAYDGISLRKDVWKEASDYRQAYEGNESPAMQKVIVSGATSKGFFSIWMRIFWDMPEIRRVLIEACDADSNCFDANTAPVRKGRI